MKSWASRSAYLLLLPVCLPLSLPTTAAEVAERPAQVAIILDDLGTHRRSDERALRLPAEVTFAILPYGSHSEEIAQHARAAGRETILHMPMENVHDKPLGEGGLTHLLDETGFLATLESALARVPGVAGISNHMGSFLTQQGEQMSWLMSALKRRGLYFIDSRTTAATLAASMARYHEVPETSRDVFLDNTPTFYEIDREFQRLLQLARRRGSAIAIGHPHDVTLTYLEMALPLLEESGIHLVRASLLLDRDYSPVPGTMIARGKPGSFPSAGSE